MVGSRSRCPPRPFCVQKSRASPRQVEARHARCGGRGLGVAVLSSSEWVPSSPPRRQARWGSPASNCEDAPTISYSNDASSREAGEPDPEQAYRRVTGHGSVQADRGSGGGRPGVSQEQLQGVEAEGGTPRGILVKSQPGAAEKRRRRSRWRTVTSNRDGSASSRCPPTVSARGLEGASAIASAMQAGARQVVREHIRGRRAGLERIQPGAGRAARPPAGALERRWPRRPPARSRWPWAREALADLSARARQSLLVLDGWFEETWGGATEPVARGTLVYRQCAREADRQFRRGGGAVLQPRALASAR